MGEMVDHFAVLGLERAVVLDEGVVRARFHELSRGAHPDADGGDEVLFAEINEAQRVLSSIGARLRHLLELEFGERARHSGAMSEPLMELFSQVGNVLGRADVLIAKRGGASSALAKALLAGEEMALQQSLMEAGGQVMARRNAIASGLDGVSLADRDLIEVACHELAFLEKWQRQIQERIGSLF